MTLILEKPAIVPGLRIRSITNGYSPIWTVATISAGYVFIREWPRSASVELSRFWKSFEPVRDDEPEIPDELFARQPMADDDDSMLTDEDMVRIHSDGSFWAEPQDALTLYKRWLDNHDAQIYQAARRDIEAELGVEPQEEG